MATKTTVETKITAINDKGNNTAVEVRDVLTELLNFSDEGKTEINTSLTQLTTRVTTLENQDQGNLVPFHIFSLTPVVEQRKNLLWYSFKGLAKQTVNFTFKILINKFSGELAFKIDNDMQILSEILSQFNNDRLSFAVSVANPKSENANPRIWTMTFAIDFEKNIIVFNFFNIQEENFLKPGDQIFTSIHFHAPNFNFG
jgi:hypothetical protein